MSTNILVSSEENDKKRFIIGTHDGIFHSDDVVACAILTLLHSDEEIAIVRSKDITYLVEKECDIFVDVGGGYYDHHQPGGNGKRGNGIPYASAGLVWKEFGKELIRKCYNSLYNIILDPKDTIVSVVFEEIDNEIIQKVDEEDNGISTSLHTFSFISSFLPVYGCKDFSFDKSFKLVLDTTTQILEHRIFEVLARSKALKDISNMIRNSDTIDYKILEIPSQTFPWLNPIVTRNNRCSFESWKHINFVIFPYPSGGWAGQCVPPSLEKKFEQRVPFPKEWAGLTDKLPEISGVEDATFCHNGCFFVRAKSREGIIDLCKKAQNNNEIN